MSAYKQTIEDQEQDIGQLKQSLEQIDKSIGKLTQNHKELVQKKNSQIKSLQDEVSSVLKLKTKTETDLHRLKDIVASLKKKVATLEQQN